MTKRILVVDDDRAMVDTLCDVLELHGWETLRAFDGARAVAACEELAVDVVLMDVRMEGIDGVEALRRIKAHRPATRVVLMTAYAAQELLESAEREGALRILKKPVSMSALLALLEDVTRASRSLLVVDDDADYLRTLCDSLRLRGFETVAAGSLDDAVARLESERPGVVLLDLKLNHVDPETALLAIRAVSPSVLLVLYSGHREALARTLEGERAGLVDVAFTKPLPIDELVEWIGRE